MIQLSKINLPRHIEKYLKENKIIIPKNRDELFKISLEYKNIEYTLPNKEVVHEGTVIKCNNGLVLNLMDSYMRRRDPNCMFIGDTKETDKYTFEKQFKKPFTDVRIQTLEWLKDQELIVMPFMVGDKQNGYEAVLVAPRNAAIFAAMVGDLQYFIGSDDIKDEFKPKAIIYVAPPFRHTHFDGKQVVVHNRLDEVHEVFSYNLYPGPSAKKGVYGVLLNIGENEGWTTLHASAVKVEKNNGEEVCILHEGASGGGKSEMGEELPECNNKLLTIGTNTVNNEEIKVKITNNCKIKRIVDDMATCYPNIQNNNGKLVVKDGEAGWFLRVDEIKKQGDAPFYEKLCEIPKKQLIFLNIQAKENENCHLWNHIIDEDTNKPCPNPRVIIPRDMISTIKDRVEVDIRSFGVRVPPCTSKQPSYGIFGLVHVLSLELAWLWRLVSPRGHGNPSIIDEGIMKSEGVGSYWPFATGKKVKQANILLEQILRNTQTQYLLIPNQHIGSYKVGFMPQWLVREWLAENGEFKEKDLEPSRCSLLGWQLKELYIEENKIPYELLSTLHQKEVGLEAYDEGASILRDFFEENLRYYLTPELNPTGRGIIEKYIGL